MALQSLNLEAVSGTSTAGASRNAVRSLTTSAAGTSTVSGTVERDEGPIGPTMSHIGYSQIHQFTAVVMVN